MDSNVIDTLASQDTPSMVVEGGIMLLTLVGVGLKIAGKNVPVIDQILKMLQVVAKVLPKKQALPPPSDPAKEVGLAAVIELKPEDKKPPEQP
jgi:hypothetical protein